MAEVGLAALIATSWRATNTDEIVGVTGKAAVATILTGQDAT
jgi:hypothetical protein